VHLRSGTLIGYYLVTRPATEFAWAASASSTETSSALDRAAVVQRGPGGAPPLTDLEAGKDHTPPSGADTSIA
jgi:hypothetical protein